MLDIGGTVLELFGEVVAGSDQRLQITAVAAGDVLPVAGHRVVDSAVYGRQRGVHCLVRRLLQLPQFVGHIGPMVGYSSQRVFIAFGPMPSKEGQQEIRDRRSPQGHASASSLFPPKLISIVLILGLQSIGGRCDLVAGCLQRVDQLAQRGQAFPDTALAVPRGVLLLELLSEMVTAPATSFGLNSLPQSLQGGVDIIAQLLELR
ncbi:hypothetical protein [Nocardia sp. NPDC047654]|uniref:hypothetical protein n=1 Tax=Nocardia sp. NPDC047654 TaxID=3364314 RepID=UPI003716D00F